MFLPLTCHGQMHHHDASRRCTTIHYRELGGAQPCSAPVLLGVARFCACLAVTAAADAAAAAAAASSALCLSVA